MSSTDWVITGFIHLISITDLSRQCVMQILEADFTVLFQLVYIPVR